MQTITATNLRQNVFQVLEATQNGETIIIKHRRREVARLVPAAKSAPVDDWRSRMTESVEILVSQRQLREPLDDLWTDHV